MTIGEIDLDCESLTRWLQSEGTGEFQRDVEKRIVQFLFDPRSSEAWFLQTIEMLAWIGTRPDDRVFLEREIVDLSRLDGAEFILCGSKLEKLWDKTCKAAKFLADHKTEILVGVAICATGFGIAAATGYALSVVAGGVVVAGAGAIFENNEKANPNVPYIPVPSSKEEIALAAQSPFPPLPKLELPASANELFVAAGGIWVNGKLFSTSDLHQQSYFVEELAQWAAVNQESLQPSLTNRSVTAFSDIPTSTKEVRLDSQPFSAYQESTHDLIECRVSQPRTSQIFKIDGKQESHFHIGWINGIDNTFQESIESGGYIQKLAGGHAVVGVYNCTHGRILDFLEAVFLNHQGYSPNTSKLLQNEWRKFHEANINRPNARLLQICHSLGAIDVKNALTEASLEIRNRVIVVAIAPAAVVPDRLCFRSYNYASENDFVYKFEPPPPRSIQSLTIDEVILPTFGEPIDDRHELIILKPHSEAEGIDHAFQSPTYQSVLYDILADYKQREGEYLQKNGM